MPYFAALGATAVVSGKPVVTPGLVKKDGLTLDKCAKACLEEKTIKCQFFKFVNSTKTCFLSETDHPDIHKYIQQTVVRLPPKIVTTQPHPQQGNKFGVNKKNKLL